MKNLLKELEKEIILAIVSKKGTKLTGKKKTLYKKRSAIEAKISEGKRTVGLGKSLYKGFHGNNIWASLGILALNLKRFVRQTK